MDLQVNSKNLEGNMDAPRLSLAQQIAQLEEAAPIDLDPEDAHARDTEEQGGLKTNPAAREHYIDVGPSALRKLHNSISDPKYDGVKATRKQLMEESEDEMASEEEEGEGDGGTEESDNNGISYMNGGGGSEDEIPSESVGEDQRPLLKEAPSKRPAISPDPVDVISSAPRIKRDEDRKKGKAVSRQIALWDTLLDARIRLQKTVTATNKLPAPSGLLLYSELPECQDALNKMLAEATALSDELFELQEHLLASNESIKPPPRKRRKIDHEHPLIDYATYLQDASEAASALEATFHPYLVQTLSKWSSKIQAVAPSVLLPSNRNAFSSKGPQHLKSVMQLIDETLADSAKLLARTQVRRSKGKRIGTSEEVIEDELQEGDPNIFDDTDFYQQLLRDVIDARGNSNGGDDDWMAVQKQKKAKKKVDTKASKGRKIRYEVHEKLQNFMVPVPVVGAWHEEQIDELFASLLGRGFEISEGLNDDEEEAGKRLELEEQLGEALKGGFRVFG